MMKGVVLGAAAVIAIGFQLTLVGPTEIGGSLGGAVLFFGIVPGVLSGARIGLIAAKTSRFGPRLRVLLLAIATVCVLGNSLEMQAMIPLACIPCVVGALILERWTRVTDPGDGVPSARIAR